MFIYLNVTEVINFKSGEFYVTNILPQLKKKKKSDNSPCGSRIPEVGVTI